MKNIEEAKKWLRKAVDAGSQEAIEKLKLIESKEKYIQENLKDIAVGKVITFGSYPQNTKDKKEPIDWRVLDIEDGKALIISKYGLDCKRYNEMDEITSWEQCTLRKWLNKEFLDSAFDSTEQNLILLSKVTADKNPKYSTNQGNDTEDKVFLLSVKEAERYFKYDEDRKCNPTKFAVDNNAYKSNKGQCWWWLRSLGCHCNDATNVSTDGSVFCFGSNVGIINYAVRPALWINLKS